MSAKHPTTGFGKVIRKKEPAEAGSVRRSVVYLSNAPADILTAYLEAKKNPKMIHFSWTDKPWFSPGIHFGEKWWMTARRTPYYSQMLVRMEEALARYILWTQE